MENYLIKAETMTEIADKIRTINDTTSKMSALDITEELNYTINCLNDQEQTLDLLLETVEKLEDVSVLTATENELASGYSAIGKDGKKISGKAENMTGKYYYAEDVSYDGDINFSMREGRPMYSDGNEFYVYVSADTFGDATAAQVTKGVTFTSSEGFCINGEMEGGYMDGYQAAYDELSDTFCDWQMINTGYGGGFDIVVYNYNVNYYLHITFEIWESRQSRTDVAVLIVPPEGTASAEVEAYFVDNSDYSIRVTEMRFSDDGV